MAGTRLAIELMLSYSIAIVDRFVWLKIAIVLKKSINLHTTNGKVV